MRHHRHDATRVHLGATLDLIYITLSRALDKWQERVCVLLVRGANEKIADDSSPGRLPNPTTATMKASPRTNRQLNDLVCDLPNWRFARNDPACIQAQCRAAAVRTISGFPSRQIPKSMENGICDVGRFATFPGRSPDAASAGDARRSQIERRGAGLPTPSMNSTVPAFRSKRPQKEQRALFSRFLATRQCYGMPVDIFTSPPPARCFHYRNRFPPIRRPGHQR